MWFFFSWCFIPSTTSLAKLWNLTSSTVCSFLSSIILSSWFSNSYFGPNVNLFPTIFVRIFSAISHDNGNFLSTVVLKLVISSIFFPRTAQILFFRSSINSTTFNPSITAFVRIVGCDPSDKSIVVSTPTFLHQSYQGQFL